MSIEQKPKTITKYVAFLLVLATLSTSVVLIIRHASTHRSGTEYQLDLPPSFHLISKNYGTNAMTGQGKAWNYVYSNGDTRSFSTLSSILASRGFQNDSLEAGADRIEDNAKLNVEITYYSDQQLHISVGTIPAR